MPALDTAPDSPFLFPSIPCPVPAATALPRSTDPCGNGEVGREAEDNACDSASGDDVALCGSLAGSREESKSVSEAAAILGEEDDDDGENKVSVCTEATMGEEPEGCAWRAEKGGIEESDVRLAVTVSMIERMVERIVECTVVWIDVGG